MEIRKLGAAELKPALALAWDVFLKDAASGFSDEGIRTFKRFIEYDSMAATLANGTTTMWAAFSGLEPIGVIAARESHICLFFVAGPHQRHGIGRRLFETFRSRRLSLAPQAAATLATDAIARSASAFAGLNPRGRMSRRAPIDIRCSAGGFPFQKKRFPGYSMFTGSISSEIRRFGGEARGRSTA